MSAADNKTMTGGHIVAAALKAHGVDTVFSVAGESYLSVLDGLYDHLGIRVVTCRQEGSAVFMAEAHAKLTGKPGIVMVTRAPGACNASIGIHQAQQGSVPVIMFTGLIDSADTHRESFQEFDIAQMFRALNVKWAGSVPNADRLGDVIASGFNRALTGRQGPVVIGLPEEVLKQDAVFDPGTYKTVPYTRPYPAPDVLDGVRAAIRSAQRPVIIAGGYDWAPGELLNLQKFAEENGLPVASAFRTQGVFDHHSASYIGELGFAPNPKLLETVKHADVVIAFGPRLDEVTVQSYTLLQQGQKFIHIYPDPSEFGKVYTPDIAVQAHPGVVAQMLAEERFDAGAWAEWTAKARSSYESWSYADRDQNPAWDGADMTAVFSWLGDNLPDDAIITHDAGNFAGWTQRFLKYGPGGRQMLAPMSGGMGYSVPAGIGASLASPGRLVLSIAGDGGFGMTYNELATVMMYDLKTIFMVCNNSMYGTIRAHQEKGFPGRQIATALKNPHYNHIALAHDLHSERVTHADDFPAAWQRAVASGKGALIEIAMDPNQISTQARPPELQP